MTATRRVTIRLVPTIASVATVAAIGTDVLPVRPVLTLLSWAVVVGGTWMLATLSQRDTIADLRGELAGTRRQLLAAADDLTAMETQRFHAEQRADRAEAAWHALLAGLDQSEAGS